MEDQGIKSNWDELARKLGAEVPPEPTQAEPEPAAKVEPPPEGPGGRREAPARRAPPKRSTADWATLGAQLGLEAPPDPSGKQPAAGGVESPETPEPSPDEPRRGRRRDVATAAEAAQQIAKAAGGEAAENDMVKTSRRAADATESLSENAGVPEPPKSASVSLWHKIFGLPAEQSTKMDESAPKMEADAQGGRSRTKRPPDVVDDRGDENQETRSTATVDEVEFDENEDVSVGTQRPEEPTAEEKPRRGRRRRRGRRSSEERTADRESDREEDRAPDERRRDVEQGLDVDDGATSSPYETTRRATGHRDERHVDHGFDLDEPERKRASSRSAAHRNIPSWEETIGTIVEFNLQMRGERKGTPPAAGRSGSSRGRTRGRRRRKS